MAIGICYLADTVLLVVTIKRDVAHGINTLLQSVQSIILIADTAFMERSSSLAEHSVNITEVKYMTHGILHLHQHTVLIGKGGFVAITVGHRRYLTMLGIVEEILLTRFLGKTEFTALVFLHLAEHAGWSLKIIAKLLEGVGTSVTGFYDHAPNLIDTITHFEAK